MPTSRPLNETLVDHWLHAALKARYQAVVREPIPEHLLQLLQGDGLSR